MRSIESPQREAGECYWTSSYHKIIARDMPVLTLILLLRRSNVTYQTNLYGVEINALVIPSSRITQFSRLLLPFHYEVVVIFTRRFQSHFASSVTGQNFTPSELARRSPPEAISPAQAHVVGPISHNTPPTARANFRAIPK
jgi:hypothetical protein